LIRQPHVNFLHPGQIAPAGALRLDDQGSEQAVRVLQQGVGGKEVGPFWPEPPSGQERREYITLHELGLIRDRDKWAKLAVVGLCIHQREVGGQWSIEEHYFIGSRDMSAAGYGGAARPLGDRGQPALAARRASTSVRLAARGPSRSTTSSAAGT
jgi:hypothetical protein